MLLLAAGGRRSQALGQYETCRQLLRAGLAVEPEQATRELYERIRTGDPTLVRAGATPAPSVNLPPPRPSPRHNLPAAVDSFVGREREMVEIRALIGDPGVRLVTLVGAGGMGKTRLALEMARELLDRYPDGVWFVDLAPLPGTLLTAAPLSPQGAGVTGQDSAPALCQAIALALGLTQAEDEHAFVLRLQERQMLLLLDNCEHVLDGVAAIAGHLLRACPSLCLIATSREPLRLSGEHLYQVPPLGLPAESSDELDPEATLRCGAVQLLAERAGAARYGSQIDGGNVRAALAVCRRLDGMPLAIELAAARLSVLSLEELAAHLEPASTDEAADGADVAGRPWALLSAGSRAAHRRQRTLLNTITWSYGLLELLEQHLFDRLSVFAGSFTLEGACAVCAVDDTIDEARVPELLMSLVDRSLVQRLPPGAGDQRYRLLETLRAFARERLEKRGEAAEVEAAHIAYYVRLMEEAEPNLRTNSSIITETMRRLDAEDADVKAAIRRALDRDLLESAMRIATAAEFWIMYHCRLQDYVGDVREALVHEERLSPVLRSKAWDLVGLYDMNWGRVDEYEHASRKQMEAALEAEDERWIGWACWSQAMCASMMGDGSRRQRLLRRALELARTADDEVLSRDAKLILAHTLPAGEQLAAIERLLPDAPQPPDAYAFQQAATIARGVGELERAERYMRITVDAWHGLDNRVMEGSMSCDLAAICLLRGATEQEVLDLHTQGQELLRHAGHPRAHLERMGTRGELLFQLGRLAEAEACLNDAVARAQQLEELDFLFDDQLGLALVRAERGEVDGARSALAAAEAVSVPRDKKMSAALLDAWGRVALLDGDAAGAIGPLREQLAFVRGQEWRAAVAPALEHLGWALAAAGEHEDATEVLAEAEREREAMGMVLYPAEVPHHERVVALLRG
jgi:predicted ATPase